MEILSVFVMGAVLGAVLVFASYRYSIARDARNGRSLGEFRHENCGNPLDATYDLLAKSMVCNQCRKKVW